MSKQYYFVGDYVSDVRTAFIVSLLARVNAVGISAPGWGKTAITRRIAQRVLENSEKRWSFTRLEPSTPTDAVLGWWDVAEYTESGKMERNTERTPYQWNNTIAILDEVFRPSDVVFDALLDITDAQFVNATDHEFDERVYYLHKEDARARAADGRITICEPPVVWGTANFVATGERVEALLDRFGIWIWIDTDGVNVHDIIETLMMSDGMPEVPGDVPTIDEVEKIWTSKPGSKAVKAVQEVAQSVADEAVKAGRSIHPRRLGQWRSILYFYSVYLTGDENFDRVPEEAKNALQWAYPATTAEEAASWRNIVQSVVDVIGSAVESVLADCVVEFKRVAALDKSYRKSELGNLGDLMTNAQQTLDALAHNQDAADDERITEAYQLISDWFGSAAVGAEIVY